MTFNLARMGELFERERERLGLSRAELASSCEYNPEQVRRVERGEQAPGARLIAALAAAGGDVRAVLLGAHQHEELPEQEALAAAEYRERIRREARDHSKLRSDRRKKVLTDDEADLVDLFRELVSQDQARLLKSLASSDWKQVLDRALGTDGHHLLEDELDFVRRYRSLSDLQRAQAKAMMDVLAVGGSLGGSASVVSASAPHAVSVGGGVHYHGQPPRKSK